MRGADWAWRGFWLAIVVIQAGAAEGAVAENPDPNTLWVEDFATLELSDDGRAGWSNFEPDEVGTEIIKGKIRLREISQKQWGRLQRLVPADCRPESGYRYLQVKLGAIEDIRNYLSVSNGAKGGAHMGKLFSGVNTFDLAPQPFWGKQEKFPLTLRLKGKRGVKPGGWVDVDWIRVVKVPYGGLVMTLVETGQPNRTAEVGEKVLFRYFALAPLVEKQVRVKCYLIRNMAPYRFGREEEIILADTGEDGDEAAGDNVYSRLVTIANEAFSFATKTGRGDYGAVVAWAAVGDGGAYAAAPFFFNIDTPVKIPEILVKAETPLTVENRLLWLERTQGENLALGKTVRFSMKPEYRLTMKGGSDARDLTDGKLASRGDDHIWFAADAVGWYSASMGVDILIDLGSLQPIRRVVARFLGGRSQRGLVFPRAITVVVSADGENFYEVARLTKLMPGEKDLADKPGVFYLPEEGQAYTYPFSFDLKTKARYLGLRVKGASNAVFGDEVAVIKGDFSPATVAYQEEKKIPFMTKGIVFYPLKKKLYISTNIITPNFIHLTDNRQEQDRKKPVVYVMELPREVVLLETPSAGPVTSAEFQRDGRPFKRWRITGPKRHRGGLYVGPFHFQIPEKLSVPATACFYAEAAGYEPNRLEFPIVPIEIPQVPPLEDLHVSLAWMHLSYCREWPDFFEAWRHLGFNTVATFPRYWSDKTEERKQKLLESQAFLQAARRRGFKILYNESPFHVMGNRHKKEAEIYSQLANGKESKNPCPSYRGRFYQEEIRRIGDCYELTKPDYVFYDIELWYRGARESASCRRCRQQRAASGKPMDEFLTDLGTEMYRDMRAEIKKRSARLNLRMPIIGDYNDHAASPIYHLVKDFNKLYPRFLDLAQPSLYVQGDPLAVHEVIRENYRRLRQRQIIPWLTTGTYGEFASDKIEAMILESLLNGAKGITYYWFGDFDTALDFYYHAKALALIAPYQKLLKAGGPVELEGDNALLTYSAYATPAGEMLILVGNYQNARNGKAVIKLPFKKVVQVLDVREGKELPAAPVLNVEVQPQKTALFYVRGEN